MWIFCIVFNFEYKYVFGFYVDLFVIFLLLINEIWLIKYFFLFLGWEVVGDYIRSGVGGFDNDYFILNLYILGFK